MVENLIKQLINRICYFVYKRFRLTFFLVLIHSTDSTPFPSQFSLFLSSSQFCVQWPKSTTNLWRMIFWAREMEIGRMINRYSSSIRMKYSIKEISFHHAQPLPLSFAFNDQPQAQLISSHFTLLKSFLEKGTLLNKFLSIYYYWFIIPNSLTEMISDIWIWWIGIWLWSIQQWWKPNH